MLKGIMPVRRVKKSFIKSKKKNIDIDGTGGGRSDDTWLLEGNQPVPGSRSQNNTSYSQDKVQQITWYSEHLVARFKTQKPNCKTLSPVPRRWPGDIEKASQTDEDTEGEEPP